MSYLPPPQVAEHSDPGVASQWYRGREQEDPSPPQTPHSSTRRVEPTRRSQPTLWRPTNRSSKTLCPLSLNLGNS
ncbi:jg15520 [Pararge aegeria aegeria]|uniref:Jg15520 protein n=1 Tax=Pararge aegeria aegeria TaxID=348720 RepID=A0A8S4SFD0_9NEOP|nr:jg15520 [Pararge aegeria aegeria]